MKLRELLNNDSELEYDMHFRLIRAQKNIENGLAFSKIVILFEILFITIALICYFNKVSPEFMYRFYILMYVLMIVISLLFRSVLKKEEIIISTEEFISKVDKVILLYSTFLITWGGIISLMDQRMYSNMNAFFINLIVVSILFHLRAKIVIIQYFTVTLSIYGILPFVQDSSDIIIGHYVNVSVFLISSLLASRVVYNAFCKNYKAEKSLRQQVDLNEKINKELTEAVGKLNELVVEDELTGLPNRRGLDNFLQHIEEYHLDRKNTKLSIIMLDIDHFKAYNDNYGHLEGDKILKEIGMVLKNTVSSLNDYAVRYGGEEFIYLSVNSDSKDIYRTAEKIRKNIEELGIIHEYSNTASKVTVSLGVVTTNIGKKEILMKAIEKADKALYEAKSKGKNCTCIYT